MENLIANIKLGIKYLCRYRRRYYFLLAALIFGFTVVTFITSTKDGMYDSVYFAAQSHYAGDIIVMGYERLPNNKNMHKLRRNEIDSILAAAHAAELNPQHTVFRTYHGSDSFVYFNGNVVQLKNIAGCDWENEMFMFNKMTFEQLQQNFADENGIILSVPIAERLGAKIGDNIILEVNTQTGQKNTASFIVTGIVRDASIFGFYKVYVSRLSLNSLLLYEDNECSSIGFFFEDPSVSEKKRLELQRFIPENVQLGPIVYDRDGLVREREGNWEGLRVFLYTLPIYLSEVSDLLDAMNIITYLLFAMMLITILVSAGVTYRLILNERSREIGVIRTIGFNSMDLYIILLTEIIVLGIIAIIAGFVLSCILSWAASFLSFSWFPGFEIFLKGEKLMPMYLPQTITGNVFILLFVIIMMAYFHTKRVIKQELPSLLAGDPL